MTLSERLPRNALSCRDENQADSLQSPSPRAFIKPARENRECYSYNLCARTGY